VYHTYLGLGFREDVLDGLGKHVQVVGSGDKDILCAAVAHIGQYAHPEGSGLVLARPNPLNRTI